MKIETYIKAKTLLEDIEAINNKIKELKEKYPWITTSTPDYPSDGASSIRFRNELINWLKETRKKKKKEFDEL